MGGKRMLDSGLQLLPLEGGGAKRRRGLMKVIGTNDAFRRARKLRRELTKPERLLWWALKADKTGFHFRKQHAAGPYVLDFYCDRARLCVEVDGASHELTTAHDEARDRYLAGWGIETLRAQLVRAAWNGQRTPQSRCPLFAFLVAT